MKIFSVLTLSLILLLVTTLASAERQDTTKGTVKPSAVGEKKADVSGKWSGTLEFKNAEGETKSGSAYMILKQEGNKLAGSGGPNEREQYPIRNGKVDGDRLTFEAMEGEDTMSFDLMVKGDQITGDIKTQKEGKTQTAKLSLKRLAEK